MSEIYRDSRNTPAQVMKLGPTTVLAVGASVASTPAFTRRCVVRLVSTVACHIRIATTTNVTFTTDPLLASLSTEYFIVNVGDIISVVQSSEAGALYITEMI